jgi:hypothetical protein
MEIAPSIKNLTREALEQLYAESLHIDNIRATQYKNLCYDLEQTLEDFKNRRNQCYDVVEKETYEEIIYELNELITKYN